MKNIIQKYNVITFDIFDTLISRPLFSPFDIFDFMPKIFHDKTGVYLKDFKKIRIFSEESARKLAAETSGYQDVSLQEIYTLIGRYYGLNENLVSELVHVELDVEMHFSRVRPIGKTIYNLTDSNFKDIFLISDMYFSKDFICELLNKSGYENYIDCYVSSEKRLRKKEGDLFNLFIKNTGVSQEKVLHIGDNPIGDVESPKKLGISAFQIRRCMENLSNHISNWNQIYDRAKRSRTFSESVAIGLIAEKYFDSEVDVIKKYTDFSGDPYILGNTSFGLVVVGFTTWLKKQVLDKKITKLIFLSRDGKIAKDTFDILFGELCDTEYFHMSRRAAKIPLIKTDADIISICLKQLYSTTVEEYFHTRFGLSSDFIDNTIIAKYGLELKSGIGGKFSKENLCEICLAHRDVIFEMANLERDLLVSEFMKKVHDTDKIAIVDIGYAGTMQDALLELTGLDIMGLYFATFNTSYSALMTQGKAFGYVCENESPSKHHGGIISHRFVYETIFCDSDSSFICYEKNNGKINLIKNYEHDDAKRQELVSEIHAGVLIFANEIKNTMGEWVSTFELSPGFATAHFDLFLKNPAPLDAGILSGILFEDSSGPKVSRYLVPDYENRKNNEFISNSIWKSGSDQYSKLKDNVQLNKVVGSKPPTIKNNLVDGFDFSTDFDQLKQAGFFKKNTLLVEYFFVKLFSSDKIFTKYCKARNLFFLDSKHKLLKYYFNIYCYIERG